METINSYWVTERAIRFCTAVFAGFTLLLHLALYFGFSLAQIATTSAVFIFSGAVYCTWFLYLKRALLSSRSKKVLFGVLILAIVSGVISASVNSPEEDDSLYAPFAVQSLGQATKPIGFDMDWIVPFSSGEKFKARLASLSNAVPYFWATVSHLFGIDFLVAYTILGSFFFGAAFLVIYFYLISHFVPDENAALLGGLAVLIAVYLVFREDGLGYGSSMNKIWIGKAVLGALLVPLAAAFSFQFLRRPNAINWSFVALAGIASTGLSSSSLFLFPMLLMALAAGHLVTGGISENINVAARIKNSALLGLAGSYPALGAIYFNFFSPETKSIRKHADAIGGSNDVFFSSYPAFFGKGASLTLLCVLGALLYLVFQKKIRCWPLIGWLSATVVLFVNPLTSNFVSQYMTSSVAYARVFYLLPIFVLVGVAIGTLTTAPSPFFDGAGSKKSRLSIALLAVAIAALVFFPVVDFPVGARQWVTGKLALNNPNKFDLIGKAEFGIPKVKLTPVLREDIAHFVAVLPAGNTMATIDYAITFPMVTTKFPQFFLWPLTVIPVYGETFGLADEAKAREHAGQFLMGSTEFHQEFADLLGRDVKHVIVSKRLNPDVSKIKKEVEKKNFVLLEETDRYALYTRP